MSSALAQAGEVETSPVQQDSLYQSNIKKTRLYGVYIPKDIEDALAELDKLSTPEARTKLKEADESTIGKKLRFGLGRWMEYNWNFQEGSRFSHFLKDMGIWHTDDMVEFMIIIYFRHVSGLPIEEKELAKSFIEKRKEWMKAQQEKNTIETITKKKE